MPDHDLKLLLDLRPVERLYARCSCGWESEKVATAGMMGEKAAALGRHAFRVHLEAAKQKPVQGRFL